MDPRRSADSGRFSPSPLTGDRPGLNTATNYDQNPSGGAIKTESSGRVNGDSPFSISAALGQATLGQRRPTMFDDYEVHGGTNLDTYFSGPLDPMRHSKWPYFMRLHGSILPQMVLPILFVGLWSVAISAVNKYGYPLSVDSVLLTVLGFVVGMSLSFRSSTAYERYIEGRRFWQQMMLHARNLARVIWIHVKEKPGDEGKEEVLAKLTAINLILAFAQSVKHKLRYEIEYDYEDLKPLISNLQTFAKSAHSDDTEPTTHNMFITRIKTWGERLGITFLVSNPAKPVKLAKRQGKHHGNLPFEIMTYLGAYLEGVIPASLPAACWQTQVSASQLAMMDAYGGCERVLQTPLPLAYSIAIAQITWLYVLVLPFQLYPKLGWATVPGTVVAAYIILGLAAIGQEIENPFGRDVNDLDLDRYCTGLEMDLNVLTSRAPAKPENWMKTTENLPLWPYRDNWTTWKDRTAKNIRAALEKKVDHQSVWLADNRNSSKRAENVKVVVEEEEE